MKHFVISIFIFTLSGCAHDLTNPETIQRIAKNAYDEELGVYPAFRGWVKANYKTGELRRLAHYSRLKLDGEYFEWRRNGQKSGQGLYTKGKLLEYITWKPDGSLVKSKVADGEGVISLYHDNGSVHTKIKHEQGYRHGEANWWHNNGKLYQSTYYKYGQRVGTHQRWHSNGERSFTVDFIADQREGQATWWNTKGLVVARGGYAKDKLNGRYITWYDNGNMKAEQVYEDGDLIEYVTWKPNGEQVAEAIRDGHGKRIDYYSTGVKSFEGEYSFGKLNGMSVWSNRDGTSKLVKRYSNGKVAVSESNLDRDNGQRNLRKLAR